MDTRDFSVDTIEEIYDIIEELKNQGTFLDSMGDFWIRGEPDAVMLCTYAANGEMEEYYRKYADSMNLTKEKFGKIVENVRAVDKKYQEKFTDAKEEMQDFQEKLKNLAQEISMRTISLSEGQYRRAVEVLEGEDNQKKRQLETLIGVTRGSSGSSRMEEKIREILKYSVGNGNLEDELDVESTESGISQKRKMITKVEELKQQFKKGKITQDELISQICELYHVEDYGSKINYSLAVKKYQPEKKAAIVSDIFSTVLYIIGEDGIDAEKIEEIRQSVSAKSYIDDESWDMVEKAFRGVVVGVNAAVAADYYGNVGKVETSYGKSSGKLNWDAIVSKKGETRVDHINRHAVSNNSRETHGVFNGNPIDMVNDAWEQRHLVEPISDGMGGTIYNIPYKNAGYESGYINTGAQMNYITIVTLDESTDLIMAFPSFGDYHK